LYAGQQRKKRQVPPIRVSLDDIIVIQPLRIVNDQLLVLFVVGGQEGQSAPVSGADVAGLLQAEGPSLAMTLSNVVCYNYCVCYNNIMWYDIVIIIALYRLCSSMAYYSIPGNHYCLLTPWYLSTHVPRFKGRVSIVCDDLEQCGMCYTAYAAACWRL
jgi:hypothetical protein